MSLDTVLIPFLLIFLFLLISAFFSAAETALTALSRARIFQLVKEGNKRAATVSRMRQRKESMIGAVLLGNNAVNIAASALATSLSIKLFNEHTLLYVTAIMTVLVVVFTEILPKTYAIQNAERVALKLAPPLSLIVKILYPITRSIQWFIGLLLKLFGIDITQQNTLLSATDVLRGTIELHHREGRMVKQDRDMLGSILDLNDIEARHVMIHRKAVIMIDAAQDAAHIIDEAFHSLHSRIPLWLDEPDNIIGILYVKDLIKAMGQEGGTINRESILALAKKPWFIPETTNLRDQLLAFRSKKQHFALVVDEYGAWLGILTLEDILEVIVGEIHDEHDEAAIPGIVRQADGSYAVNGNVNIRDLNRQLDWQLPEDEASTIAGLVIQHARQIPPVGSAFTFHGARFTVLAKDATKVTRLNVCKVETPKEDEA